MKSKGTLLKLNGQTKIQQKHAYENYDGYGIVPCSGRIDPDLCVVMGYPM